MDRWIEGRFIDSLLALVVVLAVRSIWSTFELRSRTTSREIGSYQVEDVWNNEIGADIDGRGRHSASGKPYKMALMRCNWDANIVPKQDFLNYVRRYFRPKIRVNIMHKHKEY